MAYVGFGTKKESPHDGDIRGGFVRDLPEGND